MEIKLASDSGFCFGVKRAIELASKATKDNGPIYSLGPLIHNRQVVSKLSKIGIKVVRDLSAIDEGTIIIPSHGFHPELLKEAEEKGMRIVDATCPLVRRAQRLAQRLKEEGYTTIIVGEREHAEVRSLLGFVNDEAIVLERADEVRRMVKKGKVGIISQTTQSMENFREVVALVVEMVNEAKIFNTICKATIRRQRSALELAHRVDLMLIVGGRNSANTRKLVEICGRAGTKTHHIEEADEIRKVWFKGKRSVGITAGTSTPNWIIEEVISRLKNSIE